ncbi:hypothetical protein AgCh_020142 [Apium graveolens]
MCLRYSQSLIHKFREVIIEQIPRRENSNADAFAKWGSQKEVLLIGVIPLEIQEKPSFPSAKDRTASRRLRYKAARYMEYDVGLYRRDQGCLSLDQGSHKHSKALVLCKELQEDDVHIEDVVVEDVIPKGIVAEEDPVENPNETKEMIAEELMAVVMETTRARMSARAALEDGELPRAQPIVRPDGVGPPMEPRSAPTEEMPHLSPVPLTHDIVLGYLVGSPRSAPPAPSGMLASGHLEGQIDRALLETILDLITSLMEQVPIPRPFEYPIWKVKMAMFLEATDPEYLDRINKGPHKPTKLSVVVVDQPAKTVPKEKSEYTAEDISSIAKDAKTVNEIWDALETRCQGTDAIKKNMRTILTQDYELFDSKSDESLTDLYDRFVKLLNDLSLVDKEYDLDDSNLKFLLALPESWDLKATIIRDNYALDETTLDEINGMLKTYKLEIYQRSKRHGRKSRTVALKAEEEFPKVDVSKKGRGKALITKSDSESSSSDDDDSETESLPEIVADEEMMKLCALMVKGITKIAYRKLRRGKSFSRKVEVLIRKVSENMKAKVQSLTEEITQISNATTVVKEATYLLTARKEKVTKGKALVKKKKSWTDSSDSEDEVNYALMANADGSPETAELKGLGYGDDKSEKGTDQIKPKVNPVKFVVKTVKSDSEKMKEYVTEVKEKSTSDKLEHDKSAEVNIGLMTKKQLKHNLKEIRNVNKVKASRKNRNGKEVALVSRRKHNLLSVSQICDRGYHVDFFEEHCEVVSNSTGKVVLKGYRHGNIYEDRLSTSSDGSAICLLSRASIEESWNWHKRLSHLNFNNINELVKKDLMRGLPKSVFAPDGLCDSCQKEK